VDQHLQQHQVLELPHQMTREAAVAMLLLPEVLAI
jgi:hypothetical protein